MVDRVNISLNIQCDLREYLMPQVGDFGEDLREYLMYQAGGEQVGGEQVGSEQVGGEQVGGEQAGGEQVNGDEQVVDDSNECFEFFIIGLTSAGIKGRVVKRDE